MADPTPTPRSPKRSRRIAMTTAMCGASVSLVACDDPGVLGAPFYLMERRSGIILRRDPPAGLALDAAALDQAFVATLAALHGLDLGPLGTLLPRD